MAEFLERFLNQIHTIVIPRIRLFLHELLEELYSLAPSLRPVDPASLALGVKHMLARGEIDRAEYQRLMARVARRQVGWGDLLLLQKQAAHRRLLADPSMALLDTLQPTRGSSDPALRRGLHRLRLDRIDVEDARLAAELRLSRLRQELERLHSQAEQAGETARQLLPDETAARHALEHKVRLLEQAAGLEARLHALNRQIQDLNRLQSDLDQRLTELDLLDTRLHLTYLGSALREDLRALPEK